MEQIYKIINKHSERHKELFEYAHKKTKEFDIDRFINYINFIEYNHMELMDRLI